MANEINEYVFIMNNLFVCVCVCFFCKLGYFRYDIVKQRELTRDRKVA